MTAARLVSAITGVALGLAVTSTCIGCKSEGPAERAGKKLDRAVDKIDDAVDPKGPVEKAGRALDRAVDDAKD